jgi:hypothetical protein
MKVALEALHLHHTILSRNLLHSMFDRGLCGHEASTQDDHVYRSFVPRLWDPHMARESFIVCPSTLSRVITNRFSSVGRSVVAV